MTDSAQPLVENLVKAVITQKDPQSALNAITSRLSQYEPAQVAEILAGLDADCTTSAESCSIFIYLMDIEGLEQRLSSTRLDARALRQAVVRGDPPLAEAWARFESLPPQGKPFALGKISLLLEVDYLLNRELKDASLNPEAIPGSTAALRVLAGIRPSGNELTVESAAYSETSQRLLSEVLEELDFIQRERGIWAYHIDENSAARMASARNLLSYRSASAALSPLMLARSAENMVKRLGFIIRSTGMYPAGHPAIAPSVEGFIEVLNSFFASGPMVTLSAIGGELMVNDMQVRKKGGAVSTFLRDMAERGVSSITFQSGIDAESVLRFAGVFNKPPVYIKEHGGLAALLERREVDSITVDQFRYALVSKDGTVVGGATVAPEDTTLENIIFAELVDRLERGDTIRDLPNEELGMALKKVLQESLGGAEKQKNLLAGFVAALDPGILEKGILARRDIQKEIAWSALRKIIRMRLGELDSPDEDVRLEAVDRLLDLTLTGVERNKDNTVVQIVESVAQRLTLESSPDTLYTSIVLLGVTCEALISRGRLSTAEIVAEALERSRSMDLSSAELVSARRRAMSEALRRIDTPDVGDKLVDALLSYNEVVARQGEVLAGKLVLRNMTTRLMDVFNEPDRHQRARAYRVLRRVGSRVLPVLLARLRRLSLPYETPRDPDTQRLTDEDWFVARNVIQILGELKAPEGVDTLTQLTADQDERIREVAILALFSVDPTSALPRTVDLARDPVPSVAEVSIDILGGIAAEKPELAEELVSVFRSRPSLRSVALGAMRRAPAAPAIRMLLRQGFAGSSDMPFGDPKLAMLAIEVLREAGGAGEAGILREFLASKPGKGLLGKRAGWKAVLRAAEDALAEMAPEY